MTTGRDGEDGETTTVISDGSSTSVRWNDDGESARALARACASLASSSERSERPRVDVVSSDGFARVASLWRVYDIVACVAPMMDVVPRFTVRGGEDTELLGVEETPGGAKREEEDGQSEDTRQRIERAERTADARVERWNASNVASSSSSYDFERDGEMVRVSVGGTFDRLHAGHRLLLAAAARTVAPGGTLYIGVTSSELLANKKHSQLVEPYETRAESARAFLRQCLPPERSVDVRVGPLDASPPLAATIRDMNGLVISQETISGAEALNDVRSTAGFDPLAFVVVDLVGADSSSSAAKLSSTDLRARDAGNPNASHL